MNSSQFDNVSVVKQANVYFDGKCISHTVLLADGSRKTIGVIMPSSLTFTTGAAEVMECVAGSCRVRLNGKISGKPTPQASRSPCPAIRRSISSAQTLFTTSATSARPCLWVGAKPMDDALAAACSAAIHPGVG
jgi:uncharacterized protein YaiE (UPF0345 family)